MFSLLKLFQEENQYGRLPMFGVFDNIDWNGKDLHQILFTCCPGKMPRFSVRSRKPFSKLCDNDYLKTNHEIVALGEVVNIRQEILDQVQQTVAKEKDLTTVHAEYEKTRSIKLGRKSETHD